MKITVFYVLIIWIIDVTNNEIPLPFAAPNGCGNITIPYQPNFEISSIIINEHELLEIELDGQRNNRFFDDKGDLIIQTYPYTVLICGMQYDYDYHVKIYTTNKIISTFYMFVLYGVSQEIANSWPYQLPLVERKYFHESIEINKESKIAKLDISFYTEIYKNIKAIILTKQDGDVKITLDMKSNQIEKEFIVKEFGISLQLNSYNFIIKKLNASDDRINMLIKWKNTADGNEEVTKTHIQTYISPIKSFTNKDITFLFDFTFCNYYKLHVFLKDKYFQIVIDSAAVYAVDEVVIQPMIVFNYKTYILSLPEQYYEFAIVEIIGYKSEKPIIITFNADLPGTAIKVRKIIKMNLTSLSSEDIQDAFFEKGMYDLGLRGVFFVSKHRVEDDVLIFSIVLLGLLILIAFGVLVWWALRDRIRQHNLSFNPIRVKRLQIYQNGKETIHEKE